MNRVIPHNTCTKIKFEFNVQIKVKFYLN